MTPETRLLVVRTGRVEDQALLRYAAALTPRDDGVQGRRHQPIRPDRSGGEAIATVAVEKLG
jgi:hypothetical protein